jgi:hypothetical protein
MEICRLSSNVHEVSRDSTEKQRSVPSLKGEIGILGGKIQAARAESVRRDQ